MFLFMGRMIKKAAELSIQQYRALGILRELQLIGRKRDDGFGWEFLVRGW